MSIEKKLLGTTPVSGAVDPEGVSFDGSNDYLSRSSDLSGNADGKTFTVSFFAYITFTGEKRIYTNVQSGVRGFEIITGSNVSIEAKNPNVSTILNFTYQSIPQNTWFHCLVSVDLTSTSRRKFYIDDVDVTSSVIWGVYSNDTIDFTKNTAQVGRESDYGNSIPKSRLAHLYVDYTYRNLATESNRRLFIDSDGKPAEDQADLSPILYLPMTDASTAGSNSGTGGDFTVQGVLDTAQRAPNQDNCVGSQFTPPSSGNVTEYLKKDTISGISSGSTFTISAVLKRDDLSHGGYLVCSESSSNISYIAWDANQGYIKFSFDKTDNSIGASYYGSDIIFPEGKQVHFVMSYDMSDESKCKISLNGGTPFQVTHSTFSQGSTLDLFSYNGGFYIGAYFNLHYSLQSAGSYGEFWFDDSYVDLATDNPFWDSDANRPKPVRQVISETGTTPLVALPMQGNAAGNNLGTGGDFTVYGGPYTGVRGGSEFWARSAKFPQSVNSYIGKSGGNIASNSNLITMVVSFRVDSAPYNSQHRRLVSWAGYIAVYIPQSSSTVNLNFNNLGATTSTTISADTWVTLLLSADTSDTSKRHWFMNGTDVSPTYNTYNTNGFLYNNTTAITMGEYIDGDIGFFYLNNSYIDFSQESNRNLFVDQLGYPKDLTPAIEAGDIADPLIYMKFDDTSDLGANSGTAGDFTVTGIVNAGADVDPNA